MKKLSIRHVLFLSQESSSLTFKQSSSLGQLTDLKLWSFDCVFVEVMFPRYHSFLLLFSSLSFLLNDKLSSYLLVSNTNYAIWYQNTSTFEWQSSKRYFFNNIKPLEHMLTNIFLARREDQQIPKLIRTLISLNY